MLLGVLLAPGWCLWNAGAVHGLALPSAFGPSAFGLSSGGVQQAELSGMQGQAAAQRQPVLRDPAAGFQAAGLSSAASSGVLAKARLEITGYILSAGGEPLPEIIVTTRSEGLIRQVRTDAQGFFRIEGLPARDHQLLIQPSTQHAGGQRIVPAGAKDLQVILPAWQQVDLHGLVTDAFGASLSAVQVNMQSQQDGSPPHNLGKTDANGSFSARDLSVVATHLYLLSFCRAGYQETRLLRSGEALLQKVPCHVSLQAEGQAAELAEQTSTSDLPVAQVYRTQLSGRLVNQAGLPLPGQRIWLQPKGMPALQVVADAQGEFVLSGIPVGGVHFSSASEPQLSIRGLTLQSGSKPSLNLTLDLGQEQISGKVADAAGKDLAGVSLQLSFFQDQQGLQSRSERSMLTDQQGHFRFSQLGPGAHRLQVRAAGFRPVSRMVDTSESAAESAAESAEQKLQICLHPL